MSLISHFSPQVRLFFVEKGNLKFSNLKMRWRGEKFSFWLNLKLRLKFSGK